LEKVERVAIAVADNVMREVSGGVPESSPYIRYTGFGDSQSKARRAQLGHLGHERRWQRCAQSHGERTGRRRQPGLVA
jgi:hypothetical protein